MSSQAPEFTPSELIAVINQSLDYVFSNVILEGEVANFKINQGKWVFFDIKDEESTIPCFMTLFQMRLPIEDGMKVRLAGLPKITKWGKFSFTVQNIQPVGEGSLKKAFELLKQKLSKEGLFDVAKKRPLPANLSHIGVISSTAAAGYKDFLKILNARWGGLKITTAHAQVQGLDAPDQIIRALNYFNEHSEVDVIAIIRGGGSADDLAAFNDERLVRAIAASKIPIIVGIGHEVDESLADLAADVRASTPSNAAEMLSKDRRAEARRIKQLLNNVSVHLLSQIAVLADQTKSQTQKITKAYLHQIDLLSDQNAAKIKTLEILNPDKVLKQGYAILSGKISPGNDIKITTDAYYLTAQIKEIYDRTKKHT